MSNLPNDAGEWRFVIRRAPGGLGSNAMFDALRLGEVATIDAPYGRAYFRNDNVRDVVCVAGGSGVGPIASIVLAALRDGAARRIHVFEGARTNSTSPSASSFPKRWARSSIRRRCRRCRRAPPGPAPAASSTRMSRPLAFPVDKTEFYFAGPPPMVEAMNELLVMRWRAPLAPIHTDKFF